MKIGKKEIIKIPLIEIEWSEWMPWNKVKENKEEIPDKSGVYETKHENSEQRLSIGATINLRNRISGPGGLLRGKHSAGQKIRKNEDVSKMFVRWAITERSKAVEEELHKKHVKRFGSLPKYNVYT